MNAKRSTNLQPTRLKVLAENRPLNSALLYQEKTFKVMSVAHANSLVQGGKCKHCKKKVVSALDCVICNSSFHPSCAYQARVVDKSEKVVCCLPSQKSEVVYRSAGYRRNG